MRAIFLGLLLLATQAFAAIDFKKEQIIYEGDAYVFDNSKRFEKYLMHGDFGLVDNYLWTLSKSGSGVAIKNVMTKNFLSAKPIEREGKQFATYTKGKGDAFVLEEKDGKYLIKTGKLYLAKSSFKGNNYLEFVPKEKASLWNIETKPEYPRLKDAVLLYQTPSKDSYYRIPAIASANDGTLLALADERYGTGLDLGQYCAHPNGHKIDVILKRSKDFGLSFSHKINLTAKYSKDGSEHSDALGFGDPAVVADRDSDDVLVLAAGGGVRFQDSTKSNRIKVFRLLSKDGGNSFSAPEDITDAIYSNDDDWVSLFVASGRVMQSRYIKQGSHYRIYTAILTRSASHKRYDNYILFSDDFGSTWRVLGGKAAVEGGDEAKIEELPNGNVLITSRVHKGRKVNIFSYSDETMENGSFGEGKHLALGDGSATNGEVMIVYAKERASGEYVYLLMQSLPALNSKREGVSIFYKKLDPKTASVDELLEGWDPSDVFLVQKHTSAYSTMTLQEDGNLGFFYEDRESPGYDLIYLNLDLATVTNGKYEMAFTGIGSEKKPFILKSEEDKAAKDAIFAREKPHFRAK